MLDSRRRGSGFEPHQRHCVVSLSKNINPSLVLVQPRKTHPFITERLLMGRKKLNKQTKPKVTLFIFSLSHVFTSFLLHNSVRRYYALSYCFYFDSYVGRIQLICCCSIFSCFQSSIFRQFFNILSYDGVSWSDITPCNKIDKPLVVYRFMGKVM